MLRDHASVLERSGVLMLLTQRAERAASGRGQVVLLEAPAGMGKTTVLAAVAPRLRDLGFQVLSARASEQERVHAHGVTRSLLGPVVGSRGPDRVGETGLLDAAAGPVRSLFEPGSADEGSLLHALYWAVSNLSELGPVALVVDDAHAADAASSEFLSFLARRIEDLPVLLLVSTRPPGQAVWEATLGALADEAERVQLAPLSFDAVSTLCGQILGNADAKVVAACLSASGGNPFYLTELLAELQVAGAALTPERIATTAPPSIIRSVLLRVGALPGDAAALARAVAILGDPARLDQAAALSDMSETQAAGAADVLVDAGLLAPGKELRYRHAVLRAAVLDDLGAHDRAQRHRRAAHLLRAGGAPDAVVAGHLTATEPVGDADTAAVLLVAGRDARATGSPQVAAILLRRALAEPPAPGQRDSVLFELGLAEAATGSLAALDLLRESISATTDSGDALRRGIVVAELARKAGLVAQGLDILDEALGRHSTQDALRAEARMVRFWAGRNTVETYRRVQDDRDSLGLCLDSQDGHQRAAARSYLAMECLAAGNGAEHAHLDAVLAEHAQNPAPPDAGHTAALLFTLYRAERHEDFNRVSEMALEGAGLTGSWIAHVLVSVHRAMALLRVGLLQEAEAEAAGALAISRDNGWPLGSPELPAVRALVALAQGNTALAERLIDTSGYELSSVTTYPEALLLEARGRVRLVCGRAGEALRDFELAGEVMTSLGLVSPAVSAWRSGAALAHARLGKNRAAEELAEAGLDAAQNCGPITQSAVLRSAAAHAHPADRLELLARAVEIAKVSPARLEHAEALVDLGAALRRASRLPAARDALAEGIDLATRAGATRLADRGRDEMRAAGGRPRRTAVSGPESLTPSELRCARLAASGLTNTAIAQTLFVSTKTVEKHLASTYSKLAITSRADLSDRIG